MIRSFIKKHPKLRKLAISILSFPQFVKYYIIYPLQGFMRIVFASCNKKFMKEIKNIKNSCFGKRCFIVATGPSLTVADVNALESAKEITFGLNSIFKMFDKVSWRPNYYVCADLELMKENIQSSGNTFFEEKAIEKSFTDMSLSYNKFSGNVIYLPINRQLHGMKTILDDNFKFSLNPIYTFYDYYTVTALAMLLAAYMGFKEIYLLGCDCNYMGKLRHADGMTSKEDVELSDDYFLYAAVQMQKGYTYLNKKLLKKGVTTYNATRGGALEVFPRVNFDDIIGIKK